MTESESPRDESSPAAPSESDTTPASPAPGDEATDVGAAATPPPDGESPNNQGEAPGEG